ncbi:DUF2510 domain-containing protein [Demequina sp. NBRC 110052]|uniref:DUF2510 domain-containing protein n=1 Tax=Demequina sp. NBRC 110052 TaxID=1570341 RepID=UPI00190E9BB0|nr:DUF2510 domain-containing protein [Demequina sp. NBRC 110052]
METMVPAGWYADPQVMGTLRYWDGARWTEHTAPMPPPATLPVQGQPMPGQVTPGQFAPGRYGPGQLPTQAPATEPGPNDAMHWIVPVGRSWQSIAAGYLAFASLLFGMFGPLGIVVGGGTLWISIWALRLAKRGGHGSGRAIFGIVGGSIGLIGGLGTTALLALS